MHSNRVRRRWLQAGLSAFATSGLPAVAQTNEYPARPVKLVVGAPPGGPSDFMGRMFADQLTDMYRQGFVVENKPGASGVPAADSVAKAQADGHTLLVSGPASIAVAPHLFAKVGYDPLTDLVPISMLGAGAFVLVAHPSLAVRNVGELISAARARPSGIAYGSGGNGSSGHLCTELFSSIAGLKMLHVPYKGDGQAVGDLMAGQIQLMFTAPNVAMPHVKAGRLQLLAVTTRDRVPSMPDVATVHESGLNDFEYLGWIITFAPAATPASIIESLAAAWQKARGNSGVRDKLVELAMYAPERLSVRAPLSEFVRAEHRRLGKLIAEAGIRRES